MNFVITDCQITSKKILTDRLKCKLELGFFESIKFLLRFTSVAGTEYLYLDGPIRKLPKLNIKTEMQVIIVHLLHCDISGNVLKCISELRSK